MKKNATFFDEAHEPDSAAEGVLKLTKGRVSFDAGITKMFAAIGAGAVRVSHEKGDIEIVPVRPAEPGAIKLQYKGDVSFVEAEVGGWDGFELVAFFYPEDPQAGLTVMDMADEIQRNRENLTRVALAA